MVTARPTRRRVILLDNGSLAPASTRQLRRLAGELSVVLDTEVSPVSLAHSDKIAASELDDEPAQLLETALERAAAERLEEVVVVPLFIGPSHAITRHVPAVLEVWRKREPGLRLLQAEPLHQPGEKRLGQIVSEHTRVLIEPGNSPRVALVDHGSPSRAVTEVRDLVAAQVRAELGVAALEVVACSMERRAGAEFDFNEPTLEHLLARDGWRSGPLVVAFLFIAPGRHAGPDGDIATAVRAARGADRDVRFTPLLGAHPRLIEILADRVREARAAGVAV